MRSIQVLFLLATASLAQSAFAQGIEGVPFNGLQAQIDELTQALENMTPDSSVEGRTYCSVLTQTILRADSSGTPPFDRDGMAIRVIRRTFTFLDGGTNFEGVLDGVRVQNNLNVVPGLVSVFDPGASPSPIEGTYIQNGQKLDMNITTIGMQATWYVSKDGSVIHGTHIDQAVNTSPIGISTLFTREWTLVENDTCDGEGE